MIAELKEIEGVATDRNEENSPACHVLWPILAGTGSPATAQQAGTAADEIDTVYTFNEICYSKVPNIQAIMDMALELGWKPLDNARSCSLWETAETASFLGGWDVQVGEKFYRLGLSQGPVRKHRADIS